MKQRPAKMRVAIYSGTIPSTTFIEKTIRGLSDKGLEIVLIGTRSGNVRYPKNVTVVSVPGSFVYSCFFGLGQFLKLFFKSPSYSIRLLRSMLRNSRTLPELAKKAGFIFPVANQQVNILHLQWGKAIRMFPEMFELKDMRIALSFRGTHINISPLADKGLADAYRNYFPRIDAFHAVSRAIAEEGAQYGADPGKIKVIYTSIPSAANDSAKLKKRISSPLQIISVGRFHWVKGYVYALDAMRILKERDFPFHYTLVAEGKIPEEILFQIEDQGLSSHVTLIPGMDYASLLASLPRYDVFLLPSVGEGIANVVLEAMYTGIPTLSADCGGMREVILDGENGFLVPAYSGKYIADAVVKIHQLDETEINRICQNASGTLTQKFDPDRQIDEFMSFYRSLPAA